jgi:hypothetical protein
MRGLFVNTVVRRCKLLIIGHIFIMFLGACGLIHIKGDSECTLPPEEFSEDDLVGIWKAGRPERNDTLIISENGKYKQIIHVEMDSFDYESAWHSWWVEYNESGIPYLHLEEMRMCVYFTGVDCNQSGSAEIFWYDFCLDELVQTPDEGVLMILGVPEKFSQPPRGIELISFQGHDIGATVYQLQDP